ncbi:hypothetical protein ACM66B_003969 [Microbotryomycetes sp. NB124-2]
MGCANSKAASGATTSEADAKRTKEIDRALSRDREAMKNTVKLLLLGAGESGKSTLCKQMRLIYRDTYTPSERLSYREVVYANAVQSMQVVIRGFEALSVPLEPSSLVNDAQTLLKVDGDRLTANGIGRMDPKLVDAIARLWHAESTKRVIEQSNKLQLNDSAAYFFENIQRIGSVDYIPTDQDILRTRVRSTGIVEEKFQMKNNMTLAVFDVGGQRIHCFENVQVLVFVAAINEYDQCLWEDEAVSRMSETMMLFESIVSSRWFEKSTVVLLLNKTDLFTSKILANTSPLSKYFNDYPSSDDGNVEVAKTFMLKKFVSLANSARRGVPLYTHFSCATDTEQVRVVMAAVLDTVLANVLNEVGFL